MSNKNGKNGDSENHRTAVEVVEERISVHLAEEGAVPSVGLSDPPEGDPLQEWKRRAAGSPVTMEDLHTGLLSVAQYAEAAIVYGVKISSNLNKVIPTIEANAEQIKILVAKVETVNAFVNQLDDEFVEAVKSVRELRRDVQFVKDNVEEIKASVRVIPAIKEMLGEIIARLPDPKSA